MSHTQDSPHRSEPSARFPWPLIIAVVFLAISLVISVAWIVSVLSGPASPTPEQAETRQPGTPSGQSQTEDKPEVAASEQGAPSSGLIIALAPLGENAPALDKPLARALDAALQGAALPESPSFQMVTLSSTWASVDEIDLAHDAPDADLLIAWEQAEEGLIRFYLLGVTAPPLPEVDSVPRTWDLPATGDIPLYASEADGLALPAGLTVGLLEASAGAGEQAFGRFQALQALLSAIPIDKMGANQAVLLFCIARAQTARGDLTAALQTYSQALTLQDDFAAASINRGNVYLALGDPAAALSTFDDVQAGDPVGMAVLYNRVLAHQMAGDLDAAQAAASQAVEQAPDAAWSANLRGIVSYLQGNYAPARDDFAAARQVAAGQPEPVYNHAVALFALEDFKQALAAFDDLLEIAPDNPAYWLHQGEACQANGDEDQAEEAYSRAIELNPTFLEAYLRRARLYQEMDAVGKSHADAEQAISLSPDDGRAYQIIGDLMLDEEEFAQAEDAYTESIERGVESSEIYTARGWARHRIFYNGGAIQDYERALELGAKDNILLFRLGFALFDAGRYQDSLEALSGAVNGGLDTAEGHAVLALALDTNLRRDEADQEYQHALELDQRFADKTFLSEQPLWSQGAINRAMSIVRRIDQ